MMENLGSNLRDAKRDEKLNPDKKFRYKLADALETLLFAANAPLNNIVVLKIKSEHTVNQKTIRGIFSFLFPRTVNN